MITKQQAQALLYLIVYGTSPMHLLDAYNIANAQLVSDLLAMRCIRKTSKGVCITKTGVAALTAYEEATQLTCNHCNGSGNSPFDFDNVCDFCAGTGKPIPDTQPAATPEIEAHQQTIAQIVRNIETVAKMALDTKDKRIQELEEYQAQSDGYMNLLEALTSWRDSDRIEWEPEFLTSEILNPVNFNSQVDVLISKMRLMWQSENQAWGIVQELKTRITELEGLLREVRESMMPVAIAVESDPDVIASDGSALAMIDKVNGAPIGIYATRATLIEDRDVVRVKHLRAIAATAAKVEAALKGNSDE